jgi:hypothetical protein
MEKEPLWKRELKEVLAISSVFFVIFVLFLLMKKALLEEYNVNFYVVGTALIGSLIIAKVVLIFDLLPISKKSDHLPNAYRVLFRSFIYLLGYLIFTVLEHLIKGLIDGEKFSHAFNTALNQLFAPAFIASFIGVFVAFLFFNTFWVIREKYGPAALYALFFRKNS